jgi:hypothetical protein
VSTTSPNPCRWGCSTRGPPTSFQVMRKTRLCASPVSRSHRIVTTPVGTESAPCFTAFVPSSCKAKPHPVHRGRGGRRPLRGVGAVSLFPARLRLARRRVWNDRNTIAECLNCLERVSATGQRGCGFKARHLCDKREVAGPPQRGLRGRGRGTGSRKACPSVWTSSEDGVARGTPDRSADCNEIEPVR